MKTINEVFSNIDSKILESKEFQSNLKTYLDEAVNEKAETKAQDLFEAKEAEYQKSLDEMIETVTKSIELDNKEKFNESVERHVKKLSEAKEAELKEEFKQDLNEQVSKIEEESKKVIDLAISEFVQENKSQWLDEAKVEKADKIVKEFKTLAEAFGFEISKAEINEDSELQKVNESLEKSLQREKDSKQLVEKLTAEKLLNESKDGLTSVQCDKLDSLMEEVQFENVEQYSNKIEQFKNVLGGEQSKKIVESKKSQDKKASWHK